MTRGWRDPSSIPTDSSHACHCAPICPALMLTPSLPRARAIGPSRTYKTQIWSWIAVGLQHATFIPKPACNRCFCRLAGRTPRPAEPQARQAAAPRAQPSQASQRQQPPQQRSGSAGPSGASSGPEARGALQPSVRLRVLLIPPTVSHNQPQANLPRKCASFSGTAARCQSTAPLRLVQRDCVDSWAGCTGAQGHHG